MTPASKEYQGQKFDVSEDWGLAIANRILLECCSHPEPTPVLPEDRFAWMDDLTNLNTTAPGHLGRRAELLYRQKYPTSSDLNRIHGPARASL